MALNILSPTGGYHPPRLIPAEKFQLLLVAVISFFSCSLKAQELGSSLQLRNSHLWRGIEVSSGLIYTGDLHLDWKHFYVGFWGGGNSEGSYKEFDHYVGYKKNRLTLELWDIYNFSPAATYNNREYFNYTGSGTGRFWDLRSYCKLSEKVPLVLSLNAIVYGRDRNSSNTENKYSYFASAEYPVYKRDSLEISARLGYAAALNGSGEKINFFARHSGINELSLIVTRQLPFMGHKVPISIWAMWNPANNNSYLQFSVVAYTFKEKLRNL